MIKELKIEKYKDILLLKSIGRTGLITLDLLPYLDITESRLNQHIFSGNIEKKGNYCLYGSITSIYGLTEKSKKRLKNEYSFYIYKSDLTQLEHDYALTKIYMYLRFSEKESWITETELHNKYPNEPKVLDGMYINKIGKIGVEVTTNNYSKEDIELKKNFIKKYCDDYIMIHAYKNIKYTI
ncbi:hypothetical protein [Clostridium omnivorum]|uniref:Uncharacterized protein n=1 Tax=Clostridium omnivorum TaxID=1604902 RepID=A0ABQ5N7D9_9CLOT|nr:hypothetical protein [Clostridium sp. E14]GLC31148.1 hypothetical protein bsdE14_25580 [Clostridium sp. E14]